jgi:GntR family transcriptional regulator/MocR family aminotransferase
MEEVLFRIRYICLDALNSKNKDIVLYDSLFKAIKEAIENNDLPHGSYLPSTRKLSELLNVSRSTIVHVYDLLKLGKLIDSRPGSSFKVQKVIIESPKSNLSIQNLQYPPLSLSGSSFMSATSLLESVKDEETAFRPGLPALDIFPVNQWKVLNNLYWRHVKDAELSYASSTGTSLLRETLSGYLNYTRKIKCDPRQIIIVSGSLQSLYAIGTVLLNPDDLVSYENPTFPNVISIFKGLRSRVKLLPVDEDGLVVSDLQNTHEGIPKIVHTAPSCHYPTGVRMSLERRLELINWAAIHGGVIIENDYEHEINNYFDFIPSIYSLDRQERTFFLGTFNRLMHPSIRIGYMIVPHHYLDAVEALLRHLHRFVPNSQQHVLSGFIEKNYLYNHIQNLMEIAEERKEYFCNTFNDRFDGLIRTNDSLTKSLHLLTRLPDNVSDRALINMFRSQNIAAHSYSRTFAGADSKQGLIMGYAPVNIKEMKENIIKMEKIYRKFVTAI